MTSRKNQLRSLFGTPGPEIAGEAVGETPAVAEPQKRTTSAAVKAMGLSLGSLSQDADEARRLREVLAAGEQVIEIDTAMLERSPYLDRLSEGSQNDEDFVTLKRSIAESGQQVPILVRPHPNEDKAARGIYQIAYGHRRAQAARELGQPVRAVVRKLDDAALVLAQGKENAERRGLSFIERAFFAKTLLDHGFDRNTAMTALAVHKSEMSRLVQVTDTVPGMIVRAIGPAPKAGRPRWVALGELLEQDAGGLAQDEISSQAFRDADSDTRFQRLFDRLNQSARGRGGGTRAPAKPKQIRDGQGRAIAGVEKAKAAMRLTIPDSAGEGFADYVAQNLPQLHAQWRAQADKDMNKR